MYGAILGDIIGSPYERHPAYTKDFPLFRKRSHFTDDTVMTIAVAETLLHNNGIDFLKNAGMDILDVAATDLVESMQKWGRKYPHAGYGGKFREWLYQENPRPYNSYGNGSAMRVSPVGWIHDREDWTKGLAWWTARVTHNHEEGIKGAQSVAVAICMARLGKSKEEIKDYIESSFDYDLSRTIDEIRENYHFEVSCQKSVPESIIAFLEADDFESTIKNAIWLGGDADTQAAIAGSIAEAFYGIPENLIDECRNRLPEDMLEVLDRFYEAIGGVKIAVQTGMNEEFRENVMYIHTSAGGAMGDAGAFDILDITGDFCQNGEYGQINFKLLPSVGKRNKNGFTYFYMGCGHDLYVNDKVLKAFCKEHHIDNKRQLEIDYYKWYDSAMKTIAEYKYTIRPDRLDRFMWHEGDLKVLTPIKKRLTKED